MKKRWNNEKISRHEKLRLKPINDLLGLRKSAKFSKGIDSYSSKGFSINVSVCAYFM